MWSLGVTVATFAKSFVQVTWHSKSTTTDITNTANKPYNSYIYIQRNISGFSAERRVLQVSVCLFKAHLYLLEKEHHSHTKGTGIFFIFFGFGSFIVFECSLAMWVFMACPFFAWKLHIKQNEQLCFFKLVVCSVLYSHLSQEYFLAPG